MPSKRLPDWASLELSSQRRVVWMWFGAFPGAIGLGRAPTPVFLTGESQGQGSLMGCLLWGCTESDTTEGI